ncbi:hypothetical protein ACHAQJ_007754 [Trichoderma viride]
MSIVYRRLDPSKREIRLLEIHCARNISDPVECKLITTRLTDDLEFIALSSLYGDAAATERIWVSGQPSNITTHLAGALKNIRAVFYPTISRRFQRTPARRPHGAPRWLRQLFGISGGPALEARTLRVWVDLICVDQCDEQERQRQTLDMRQIYKSAELVIGWLGEKSENTDAGMAVLGEIEDIMPARFGDPGDREAHPEDYAPEHRWAKNILHLWTPSIEGMAPFEMPYWIGYVDFMTRQYFQRRWILEEIALARFPAFLIGDTIVPWKQVLRLNRMMEEFRHNPSDVYPQYLKPAIAELPLETSHKLLDEFARREALEEARILLETGKSRATSSTRSNE